MKNLSKDFPFIFNTIYIFAIFIEVLILILGNRTQFNYANFIQSYQNVGKSIFFLPWVGLVINIIFYLVNLNDGWILAGCLAGIAGYMVLAILPEFFYVGLIFLWIGLFLFYRSFTKRRQRVVNHADPK
ncbi:hypothetical protein [Xylocopilactobacillus apicola]|uniref:Multipass membrane protein n=1 Tax=Xylocopilactobacillus apicola TaxID=2932184 RepID=A0AAU9DWI7_9LACO|nr:hypothetical protein [Xylocopilactobacillus apicola]BDR58368.1 hypothetical protein XA3_08090 [Xylocopilactobacillus apicola]